MRAPAEIAVLIPAFRPAAALEDLISQLLSAGVPAILLVDDGSPSEDRPLFDRLARHSRVHLLRHEAKQGKGIALKTGIAYFLRYLSHYRGVVTANADGGHAADDVLRLGRALVNSPQLVILGARAFGDPFDLSPLGAIPLRSRLGNRFSALLFRMISGVHLSDVQTGMRALPTSVLAEVAEIPGRGFEYEMRALRYIVSAKRPIAEQPIRTLQTANEAWRSFQPWADSMRLLRALLTPVGRASRALAAETSEQALAHRGPGTRSTAFGDEKRSA